VKVFGRKFKSKKSKVKSQKAFACMVSRGERRRGGGKFKSKNSKYYGLKTHRLG